MTVDLIRLNGIHPKADGANQCPECMCPCPCLIRELVDEAFRAYGALGKIGEYTKGEPKMSGATQFRSWEFGRIHNMTREGFGEEPLTIANTP